MGCSQSKATAGAVGGSSSGGASAAKSAAAAAKGDPSSLPAIQRLTGPGPELHRTILNNDGTAPTAVTWAKVCGMVHSNPSAASFVDPDTLQTPLHSAARQMTADAPPLDAIRSLIRAAPDTVTAKDKDGNIPLHYALMAPVAESSEGDAPEGATLAWKERAAVVAALVSAAYEDSVEYISRTDHKYGDSSIRCTALYHAISIIPDDFNPTPGPTVEFVRAVHEANPSMVTVANASDGDKPLTLLYRRFSRQFDQSEKFFAGDNSRPEVLGYRQKYKASAMNTWRVIQLLLRPLPPPVVKGETNAGPMEFKMVHAAVQMNCPADLLRYIIETKPNQVQETDPAGTGRLPLHCAAAAVPPKGAADDDDASSSSPAFPAYYSKFVIDELLYAHSDAAAVKDGDGKLPLCLAIESGKTWIGGGIKSLYDAYPDGIKEIDMDKYPSINEALSFSSQQGPTKMASEDGNGKGTTTSELKVVKKEEHYDAIMLVQKPDACLDDIVSAMWANEEDGGIQMLGCIAVAKRGQDAKEDVAENASAEVVTVSLTALSAIVNAMKNHPNEPAVQEKACQALNTLSASDGHREISFAASGAVASIVAAMQAHVSDPTVQKEACAALYNITRRVGADRATVIASVSGFTAIQNSLGAHPDDVRVQKEACRALELVTSYEDANLPQLPGLQAAPLLQQAAEKFPDECKEYADIILGRIAPNDGNDIED